MKVIAIAALIVASVSITLVALIVLVVKVALDMWDKNN